MPPHIWLSSEPSDEASGPHCSVPGPSFRLRLDKKTSVFIESDKNIYTVIKNVEKLVKYVKIAIVKKSRHNRTEKRRQVSMFAEGLSNLLRKDAHNYG